MDLSPLNPLTATGLPEEAGLAVGEAAVDGDAFTQLIAQLGGTPVAAPAVGEPAAPAIPTPTIAAPEMPLADGASAPASEEGAATTDAAPIDLASLNLPPLVAAMMAPVLAPVTTPAPSLAATPAAKSPSPAHSVEVPPSVVDVPIEGAASTLPATATPVVVPKATTLVAQAPAAAVPLPVAPTVRTAVRTPELPAPAASARADDAPAALPPLPAATPPVPLSLVLPTVAPTIDPATPTAASVETDLAPAEVVVERQLDLARDGEWLDQLARDIARTASADAPLRFRLNPEHLGSLHVEVTQGAAGASVRLTADTEAARTIIADARPQLVAEARAQGVRIVETHVDLGSNGGSGGGANGQSGTGQGQRDARATNGQTYLTSWKPESSEETSTPPRRSRSERYA